MNSDTGAQIEHGLSLLDRGLHGLDALQSVTRVVLDLGRLESLAVELVPAVEVIPCGGHRPESQQASPSTRDAMRNIASSRASATRTNRLPLAGFDQQN